MTELSIVIPVYNAEGALAEVVARVHGALRGINYEIVLVNDGSIDGSHGISQSLVANDPLRIQYILLSKNFGEHHAVLAGLAATRGAFVAILDDDGQNPPEELPRMLEHIRRGELDVLYGRYVERKHVWYRQLGSWFNDQMANLMLRKPRGLYLSSFKIMNRFVVDELLRYRGPYPYLDGLICRITNRLAQLDVRHDRRVSGQSGYTLRRLIRLWLNMFLGFSILPLRLSVYLGFLTSLASALWLVTIIIDKLWINPTLTVGIPTVLACSALFSGVQLIVLGMIGEYVGRVFLAANGQPQYVVRYSTFKER